MFTVKKASAIAVFIIFFISLLISTSAVAQTGEAANQKTIERYKQMLAQKPYEGSVFDRFYQLYLEGAGPEQLATDYQDEIKKHPEQPHLHLVLGHVLKRLGREAEAIEEYKLASSLAPEDYYPHLASGRTYALLRQYEQAIPELESAVKLQPSPEDLVVLYKTLGKCYARRDKMDEAVKVWQQIARIDPKDVFARLELADIFAEQELYAEAMAQHQAMIELKKSDPYRVCLSLREIGRLQEAAGNWEEAIKAFDKAIAKTAPGNWLRKEMQARIVAAYANADDLAGLLDYYQTKLKSDPKDMETLGLLADAYMRGEQMDEAMQTYRKALALAPSEVALRRKLIVALKQAEQFQEAVSEYQKLIGQDSEELAYYRELGELYLTQNRFSRYLCEFSDDGDSEGYRGDNETMGQWDNRTFLNRQKKYGF